MSHVNKRLNLVLLILLTLCWGPAFFFIKIALTEVSITTIATTRVTLAALLLFIIIKIRKDTLRKWIGVSKHFIIMAFLANLIPLYLTSYVETKISSSLTGILNASQPIFAALLAHYLLETERFTLKSLLGIAIGFSGILCIFLPSVFGTDDTSTLGVILMIIAALSSSSSAVYARKFLSPIPSLISATYQFAFSTLFTLPFALIINSSHLLEIPSIKVLTALFILGMLSSGTAYIIFYYLVKHAGATYVSTASLLLPFTAIVLGVTFLNEKLYWTAYIGCILIVIGLIITNSLISMRTLKNLFRKKNK